MRETTRDEKWYEEPKDYAPQMHQAKELPVAQPSETDLVQVALLMRIYDVQLALLAHFDEKRADEVYEHHEKGGHFNPNIFIPDMNAGSNADEG